MKPSPISSIPQQGTYDVVIVGGAMIGSSVANFLSQNPEFDGSILVVERDLTYEFTSTAHTNSCIRQQFSNPINIQISQFGVDYIKNFARYLDDDPCVPKVPLQSYGYMYLADNDAFAGVLKENQLVQHAHGAGTQILSPEEIARAYPFYALDDIICGSHNLKDEGYFDGNTLFDWWKRKSRERGVEYVNNEVVGMKRAKGRIDAVQLKSGELISCGTVVNASGPRAVLTARMAGLDLPVEPRRRYTFIFSAEDRLDRDLPLTIDPSGIHMRTDGMYYLAGCAPDEDDAVDYDDFDIDHSIWEEKVWPVLATRVPAFERVKLINIWAGHYAFNTLDQNAIIGRDEIVSNFIYVNGFSGHGFQQSPAMGRGVSELITYGEFRSLDLSPLGPGRIGRDEPFLERAVI